MEDLLPILVTAAAVGSGLLAGILFTFSNFAMRALASRPPAEGMAVMQAINVTIQNPLFFALFFGTTLLSLGAVVWGALHTDEPGAMLLLAGGLSMVLGTFAVTGAGNVPLNNRLAAASATSDEGQAIWREYLVRWNRLNHVRVLSSTAAATCFVLA